MFGLFSFVEDMVSGIISQILQQANIIQDAVTAPLRTMVNSVLAGAWKGDGANRFAAEMTSEVIPMLVSIMTVNTNYANAIKKSHARMIQAAAQAASQAQTLNDVFNSVF
ncbi:MAG: hypothetical protein NTW32_12170 [Chloroflexi bacterium]|nr:hypothetical protein [Chloroflexota bacterium]